MAILVTGGAGFVGSHVVERLLARGEEVVVLDDFNDYYDPTMKRRNLSAIINHPSLRLVEGAIEETESVERAFAVAPIQAVVHLAARAGVRPSLAHPADYERVNLLGTLRLLEASAHHNIQRFVFGSSSSVYGTTATIPFNETDSADRPISPYAATKRAGELMCHTFHHLYGLPVACMRLFTVYGPRQRPDLAIHSFARAITTGKPIRVFGAGDSSRDYTYVTDIVGGLLAALDHQLPSGYEIFNLGNSHPIQLIALIRILEQELGMPASLEFIEEQPGDVPLTFADLTKSRQILGYSPQVGIEEGIRRFCAWFISTQMEAHGASRTALHG